MEHLASAAVLTFASVMLGLPFVVTTLGTACVLVPVFLTVDLRDHLQRVGSKAAAAAAAQAAGQLCQAAASGAGTCPATDELSRPVAPQQPLAWGADALASYLPRGLLIVGVMMTINVVGQVLINSQRALERQQRRRQRRREAAAAQLRRRDPSWRAGEGGGAAPAPDAAAPSDSGWWARAAEQVEQWVQAADERMFTIAMRMGTATTAARVVALCVCTPVVFLTAVWCVVWLRGTTWPTDPPVAAFASALLTSPPRRVCTSRSFMKLLYQHQEGGGAGGAEEAAAPLPSSFFFTPSWVLLAGLCCFVLGRLDTSSLIESLAKQHQHSTEMEVRRAASALTLGAHSGRLGWAG